MSSLSYIFDSFINSFTNQNSFAQQNKKFAVAVSGGPDSMALAHVAHLHAKKYNGEVFFLTVDHGLRPESAKEASQVTEMLSKSGIDKKRHHILQWEGIKPQSRILEEARKARYALFNSYCEAHDIRILMTAHHLDDQAETVLFRLAKGSGLDGLGGMRPVQKYPDNLTLYRPFLDIPKERLVHYCSEHAIDYVQDPTNERTEYYRPRIRQSKEILEAEGLTAARLARTARRLRRSRDALDYYTEKAWRECLRTHDCKYIILNFDVFRSCPEEVAFRILQKAIQAMHNKDGYTVRMQKLEFLFDSVWQTPEDFKSQTLGGFVFALKEQNTALYILKEHD